MKRTSKQLAYGMYAALIAIGVGSAQAQEVPSSADVETAALTHGDSDSGVAVPTPLGDADAERYANIFDLQQTGKWREADVLIRSVTDRLLIGHAQFQRYMHPTSYRSTYVELRNWLSEYADHPGARRVYKLALRRKPDSWKAPRRPSGVVGVAPAVKPAIPAVDDKPKARKSNRRKSRYVYGEQRKIKSLVARGRPTQALKQINSKSNLRRFDPVSFDESMGDIARGYFHAGKDQKALDAALPAAKRSGVKASVAHWWGGLAAWRLGEFATAAQLFEALARSETEADWTAPAAAFWAARAYWAGGQPQHHNRMMEIAANEPQTFYGMLAVHALGREPVLNWNLPTLDAVDSQLLTRIPAANRALALIQTGQNARAESELRRLTGYLSPQLARSLLALADVAKLPALAFSLGDTLLRYNGERHQAALFPMPAWEPEQGFTVDRALVYALMRQESQFKTNAKSRAGARGLMQLMPATAGFMAGRRFRGTARDKLFEPRYNIELGQRYISHLMAIPGIGFNLFLVTAAYNGGPGNLKKWQMRTDYRNDPLLFIESLPARETRIFVERVLANVWHYRYQMGQATPSLTAIVEGNWPLYTALDSPQPSASKVVTSGD
jgi:soluble lytic murein transglycosylase